MAYYVSEREMRRIERGRIKEDEERLREERIRQKEEYRAQQREQKEQLRKEKENMETELREMRESINRVRQERQEMRIQNVYDRQTLEERNDSNESERRAGEARTRDVDSTSREKYTENESQRNRQDILVNEGNRGRVRQEITWRNNEEKTDRLLEDDKRQDKDIERIREEEIDKGVKEDREESEHKMKELERRRHETEKEILKLQRSLNDDRTPKGKFNPHESTRIENEDTYEYVKRDGEMPYDPIVKPIRQEYISATSDHKGHRMDNSLHKTMQWIDDKFERMNDSREYRIGRQRDEKIRFDEDYGYDRENGIGKEIDKIDDLKLRKRNFEEEMIRMRREKEQNEMGYETDEEIEHVTERIEKMRLRKRMLEDELFMRRKKQEQREQEYKQRRKERKGKLDRLKREENLLQQKLRTYEDTLDDMKMPNSESDTEFRQSTKQDKIVRKEESKLMKLPKLPTLSEETFEEWKVEVEVMIESGIYSNEALLHAVRNAICNSTGTIRKVLPTISLTATTQDILKKLENIYGDRRSCESHLSEFYKSKQMLDESVAEWGVRLENILQKAANTRQIDEEQKKEMLKKRFWKHLYSEKLKLNTRLCYERCESFEELLKEVRVEERELNTDSDNSDHRSREESSVMNKLFDRIDQLEENIQRSHIEDADRSYIGYGGANEGYRGNFQRGRSRNKWQNDRRYDGNRRYSVRNYSSDRNYRKDRDNTYYNRSSRDRRRDDSDGRGRYRRYQDGESRYRRNDDKRFQDGDKGYRKRDDSRERRDYDGNRGRQNSDRNWRDSRNEIGIGNSQYRDDRGRQNEDRREHKDRYSSEDRNTDKDQEHKERDRRNIEGDKQRHKDYQKRDGEHEKRDSKDGGRYQKVYYTREPDKKRYGGRKGQSNR